MSDPAERPLTPLSSLEQLSSKDSRGNRWPSEVEDGSERRQKRPERSLTDPQLCLDPESEPTDGRKKANGPRLKPVEQLLPALSPLEDEPPSERKKSPPSQV
ncbi:unnamed protein product [Tetraodon nigroviridis]|uniref:(spotted green pufferfish) hypothetical protein n=1 Tax=Tetraodon nigroviridis TaxID=99883 RepID=Q4S287_TETNG|nr:unnamed protein product [Tetraodon nigroviridis]